jgi:ABC-type multidrug transport system ATPase subunit
VLGDPGVLVLDEPANGLDPQGIRWLRDLLRSLAAEGRAVLVSSHVLAEVAQTADEVVVIARGRSVAQAPLAELLASGRGGIRVGGPDVERLAEVLRRDGAAVEPAGRAIAENGASNATGNLETQNTGDVPGQVPGGLLLAAYAPAFVAAGLLVLRSRDVTS